MFVDACAIVSILSREPTATAYESELDRVTAATTSPLAAFEAILVLARPEKFACDIGTAHKIVLTFLEERDIGLRQEGDARVLLGHAVAIAQLHGVGKRRLSSFDCFHYAHARIARQTLLTLDELLRQTDIETAP
jgi:ribonuclease VapC